MSAYQNPQGSTVVAQREGSMLHVTLSRSIDDPPISEASWSAQLAAAARRELGGPARRVSSGVAFTRDSTGGRQQRRTATYTIDSAFTVTDRGDEMRVAVSGSLTAAGARALTARLPLDYVVRRHRGGWWLAREGQVLHKLSVGAKVVVALPPRCELAEHFGKGVAATTRTTIRGSMAPFLTVAHACTAHTPTPEQIVAHNHACGETVDSIEITDLTSGRTVVSWTPEPAAATS
ncbi:hypothetical protein IU433_22290 [Nocardia puris]|uniref:hypothetical protein n=1 Tax=Nocardia TaxID=1817 RepID=UPI0004A73B4D|nr:MULTISPECIES: hypothetical protein [Nocardia]MBF6137249.1 hypothetical protein [Nocardia otitidiscaviarum]MBF6181853.1 hypothetical protein [Nocardia otitidiscaviarum]MBF6216259.1 hypothetical protein [Nocardia puris]MBF6461746.1 hypothetical protein [Nocardia puris]MBF6488145.1 hypothetical protein [Nocardia otitidiscaviarum]